jgi:hypothetical protein
MALTDSNPTVVVRVARSKKGKRRYSRGLRDVQEVGRGLVRVSSRLSKAVARGMRRYVRESDRSARKRRDGAIRDLDVNLADALSATLREVSRTPVDIARSLRPRSTRRALRRSLARAARVNRRLFRLR